MPRQLLQNNFVKTFIKSQSIRITGALLLCLGLQNFVLKAEIISGADSLMAKPHQVPDSNYISNRIILPQPDSIHPPRKVFLDTTTDEALYIHEFEPDSSSKVKVVYKYNSSKRAVIYSMLLPGLGQIYNKKYWKLPIIYGGAAFIYFLYDYNNAYYQRFKTAYEQKVDYENMKSNYEDAISEYNDDHPNNTLSLEWNEYEPVDDIELQDMSQSSLALYRDSYRRSRDYDLIFFGLLYIANILDAMVDSYMLYYDVNDQLSLDIEPYAYPNYSIVNNKSFSPTCGVSLKIKLK